MEFAFRCKVCGFADSWDTVGACHSSAVWHIFEEHTEEWMAAMGTGQPKAPRPEALGRRFEDWERQ